MGKRKNKQNKNKKRKQYTEQRNFVAKHARTYSKAQTFEDQKKSMKKGHRKHKKSPQDGDFYFIPA